MAVAVAALILILGIARIAYGVALPRQPAGFAVAVALTALAVLGIVGSDFRRRKEGA